MGEVFEEAQKQFMLGQFDTAEELFTKFIEHCNAEVTSSETSHGRLVTTQLAKAYNNRGQIKYLRVDFDEAIDDYTAAIRTDNNFAAYYNRGQIHYRLARFQDGIRDFQMALKHQPDFPDATVALRTAHEDQHRSQSQSKDGVAMEISTK